MPSGAKLLFVGCGKMGGAMLQAAASRDKHAAICVIDPSPALQHLKSIANLNWLPSIDKLDPVFDPDFILLAVKPQMMADVLPNYARFTHSVFLSIAAGLTLQKLAAMLGGNPHSIVRSMPNLPASIGKGISVAIANRDVTAAQKQLCDQFLQASGQTAWVENEALIDAVTALSGSGPGYIFGLCEVIAKIGTEMGLPREMADRLARQMMIGSGALLEQSSDSAEILRKAVTSPGGTTEAALEILLAENGFPELLKKAMNAAAQRAKELAS